MTVFSWSNHVLFIEVKWKFEEKIIVLNMEHFCLKVATSVYNFKKIYCFSPFFSIPYWHPPPHPYRWYLNVQETLMYLTSYKWTNHNIFIYFIHYIIMHANNVTFDYLYVFIFTVLRNRNAFHTERVVHCPNAGIYLVISDYWQDKGCFSYHRLIQNIVKHQRWNFLQK